MAGHTVLGDTKWLDVTERSAVAEARRRCLALADTLGFAPPDRDRAAIVATEATTNLLKHAGRGRFALFAHPDERAPALSILALDKGPGIADLDRMSEDGQSSVGSSGTGLGAMARQSDGLDVHTGPTGTALTARIAPRGVDTPIAGLEIAALLDNYPGAAVCGDGYAIRNGEDGTVLVVCDGLGHGPGAHEAAHAVTAAFLDARETSPAQNLEIVAEAARPTRGAVGMVVHVPSKEDGFRFSGVGNISGFVVSRGTSRRLVSRDGRLGGPVPRLADHAETLAAGDVLILHSDGIRTLRTIEARQGLFARAPLTIAAVLLRDDARGNDDACVLVMRRTPRGSAS